MSYLIGRLGRLGVSRARFMNYGYTTMLQTSAYSSPPSEDQSNIQDPNCNSEKNPVSVEKYRISSNIPRKDRADFLAKTLRDLKDSKEAVYGTLDAWVAWEENFPIALIRRALNILEKEQEWHRIVQVIKWMLSKGQGTTMQTYGILILALDMDNRADEAHEFWKRKISINLHSVPWQLCRRMIAIYYRNQKFDQLVQLFEELEAFDRKPPEKSIVMRVANAYELLGKIEEKDRVLEKYNDLITRDESPKKSRKPVSKKKKQKK